MSDYPKALYKGKHYTEWTQFCIDLENKVIDTCIVTGHAQEKEKRADGFCDAGELMAQTNDAALVIPETPKKRGMPKGGWPKKDVHAK